MGNPSITGHVLGAHVLHVDSWTLLTWKGRSSKASHSDQQNTLSGESLLDTFVIADVIL